MVRCRDEGSCSSSFPHPGHIACCSAPNSRPSATKALHTICGNNTIIVSSSWWWAYKCPKYVEQIIIAIKRSVAYSRFSPLRLNGKNLCFYKDWIVVTCVIRNLRRCLRKSVYARCTRRLGMLPYNIVINYVWKSTLDTNFITSYHYSIYC